MIRTQPATPPGNTLPNIPVLIAFLSITIFSLAASATAQNIDLDNMPIADGIMCSGTVPNSGGNGYLTASAGDFNNDGYDDFIVGSPLGASTALGYAYLVLGKQSGYANVNLESFAWDNSHGFRVKTTRNLSVLGISVAGAGDYNGDGYDDFICGSWDESAYIVFGSESIPANFDVEIFDSSNVRGFRIQGPTGNFQTGSSIAGAGDINNDGFDDLLIASPDIDLGLFKEYGKIYVLFGRGNASNIDLTEFEGSDQAGYVITGRLRMGSFVSAAGDFNADGFADILISNDDYVFSGTYGANDFRSGPAFLVYGKATGFADITLNNASLPDEFMLFDATGLSSNPATSYHGGPRPIACAGDINADGFSDIVIGSPGDQDQSGAVRVIYGRQGTTTTISLATIGAPGSDGFAITGASGYNLGCRVASAGDINNDGFDDLLMNSYDFSDSETTSSINYVVYGSGNLTGTVFIEDQASGDNGYSIAANSIMSFFPPMLAPAGDVNNDEYDDILIYYSDASDYVGRVYLLFGNGGGMSDVLNWQYF